MDLIKREKENLEERMRDLETRKETFFLRLGEHAAGQEIKDDEPPRVVTLRESLEKVDRELEENQTVIREITDLAKELEELENSQKEKRQEIRDLTRNNQDLYENIGRAAYQAFRDGELTGEGLEEIFAPIMEQKDKINTYEVKLKGAPSGNSFFNKIAHRSREVFLKSNQSLGLRSVAKAYQRAGEQLVEKKDLAYKELEPLNRAFTPFLQSRNSAEVLEKSLAKGEARVNELMEELRRRDALRNSRKKVLDLEKAGEEKREDRRQLLVGLGESVADMEDSLGLISDELLKQKEALSREEEGNREEQERLERARRRLELQGTLKKLEAEKIRMEDHLKKLQQDLSDRKDEIKRVKGELDVLGED